MHASPRAPLSELFLGVSALLSTKKIPVAIATISFVMLLAVGSAAVQFRVAHIEDSLMSEFSIDQETLRTTVDADLKEISSMDVTAFMRSTGFRFGTTEVTVEPPAEHKLGFAYLHRIAPIVFLQLLFNITVVFVTVVFFLLLFAGGSQSAYETAAKLPSYVVRMCGLILWMLVRSLIWIPLVGPVISIYMGPRLALAPVFLAGGETGIFESIHMSMRRTSGHWFSVFLRLILIGITALLIFWPMLVLVVGATFFSVKLGYILLLLAVIFTIAYQCATLTVLAAMMA